MKTGFINLSKNNGELYIRREAHKRPNIASSFYHANKETFQEIKKSPNKGINSVGQFFETLYKIGVSLVRTNLK